MTKRHLAAYCALAAAAMSFGYWFRGESDASDPQQSYPENTENRGSPILAPPLAQVSPSEGDSNVGVVLRELPQDSNLESLVEEMPPSSVEETPPPSLTVNPAFEKQDQALIDEPVDPNWSPMMESVIESIVASAGVSYASSEIECRTTICRAVLTHDFGPPADGSPPPIDSRRILDGLVPLRDQHYPRISSIGVNVYPVQDQEGERLETIIYLLSTDWE